MRTEEEIRDAIGRIIVEEIQATNLITRSDDPLFYIPQFISSLSSQIHELVLDEIAFRK